MNIRKELYLLRKRITDSELLKIKNIVNEEINRRIKEEDVRKKRY